MPVKCWDGQVLYHQFSSAQSLSPVRLFATPWSTAHQASLSITNSQSSLKLMSVADQWCHPAISSSVIPFSCLQTLPASGSFPVSQLFARGGQNIGVSVSASVFPMNIQDWVPLEFDWLDLLAVQGILKSLLQQHSSKASIIQHSAFFHSPTLTSIHDHWKNHSLG